MENQCAVATTERDITKLKQTEAELRKSNAELEKQVEKRTHDLNERIKELNCLYSISDLMETPNISLDGISQGIVNLIPPAWQYPEITCAKMIVDGKEFSTKIFKTTDWKQCSDIIIQGKHVGSLEVYYLEEKPIVYEGPFLKEERALIKTIINRLVLFVKRKQLEDNLRQSQKMEAMGTLAGGIAHDFNNLLTIIIGNIELAEDDIKPEIGVSECLEEAEKACIQAKALTTQLITFSKGGTPVKEIGSIEDILTTTINSIIANSNVTCDFLISNDLWRVEFDQAQMKHAIKNLIVNAVESMPDGGPIKVRAENCIFSSEIADQVLFVSEGNYVKISIQDHGVGIPEKHLSKIFDPYFSTKDMGTQKGMGLGLSTAYSIINRHNGNINVESQVGVGTTFTLFLPAGKKDIRELPLLERHKPEKTEIRTRRILLMDDEEGIRKLSEQRLNQLGYEAELAKDGSQAVELYKKAMDSGRPFDAVILDLTVKRGMGGKDAVKALLKIDPQVNAIVSSGYSNDPVMTDFRAYGFTGSLIKPNKKEDLIEALKKIIKK